MSKKYIEGNVYMSNFYITELPEFISGLIVRGDFFCSDNKLKTLKNAPSEVAGSFSCRNNKITSLEGMPKITKYSYFDCSYNKLNNLDFGPTIIDPPNDSAAVFGLYMCGFNNLTTLIGAPEMVPGTFDCKNNLLRDLTGAPKEVTKDFICYNQRARRGQDPVIFTEEQVRAVCKVGGKVYV